MATAAVYNIVCVNYSLDEDNIKGFYTSGSLKISQRRFALFQFLVAFFVVVACVPLGVVCVSLCF